MTVNDVCKWIHLVNQSALHSLHFMIRYTCIISMRGYSHFRQTKNMMPVHCVSTARRYIVEYGPITIESTVNRTPQTVCSDKVLLAIRWEKHLTEFLQWHLAIFPLVKFCGRTSSQVYVGQIRTEQLMEMQPRLLSSWWRCFYVFFTKQRGQQLDRACRDAWTANNLKTSPLMLLQACSCCCLTVRRQFQVCMCLNSLLKMLQ